MGEPSVSRRLDLKVGDWVVVRPAEEILATLDANARFEDLPFMPQMLQLLRKEVSRREAGAQAVRHGIWHRRTAIDRRRVFGRSCAVTVRPTAAAKCDAPSSGKKHG